MSTIAKTSAAAATPRAIVIEPSALVDFESRSCTDPIAAVRARKTIPDSFTSRYRAAPECYSMPSGPREAPERNCRTNMLSELNSSSAGPDSTMRPFHSTAMYSATRLADMMSCVITT